MMKRIVCLLMLLWASVVCGYAQSATDADDDGYVEASYDCIVKKQYYKRRFGDITTSGRFLVLKVVFFNEDIHPHAIGYDCFYLTSPDGARYEVHRDASIVRQTLFEDWKIRDLDVVGFSTKDISPHMKVTGFLVFEVPRKAKYRLNFRGYLK